MHGLVLNKMLTFCDALYRHDIISVKYLLELFDKTKPQLNQNFHEKIL